MNHTRQVNYLICCTSYRQSNFFNTFLVACVLTRLVPESPRWLVANGRLREAEAVVRAAARMNRVEPPNVIFLSASVSKFLDSPPYFIPLRVLCSACTTLVFSQVKKEPVRKEKSYGFLDMLRTRNIRNVTLILWLVWYVKGFQTLLLNQYGEKSKMEH